VAEDDTRPPVPIRLEVVETTLRDGTPVLVRAIQPDDKERLQRGFQRLSEESRYRRFMAPLADLSPEQLTYLTEVDGLNHLAWVAVRGDDLQEGMGVARFVRLEEEPEVAEAAVTVVDDYQGAGLGTLLLGLLALAARSVGITAFRGYVQVGNAPIRELLDQFGARTAFDSPGVVRLDVPLDMANLPDSCAAQVLRAVAKRLVEPMPRRLVI
jgi:GNAT superfamily N-acetyltransferase